MEVDRRVDEQRIHLDFRNAENIVIQGQELLGKPAPGHVQLALGQLDVQHAVTRFTVGAHVVFQRMARRMTRLCIAHQIQLPVAVHVALDVSDGPHALAPVHRLEAQQIIDDGVEHGALDEDIRALQVVVQDDADLALGQTALQGAEPFDLAQVPVHGLTAVVVVVPAHGVAADGGHFVEAPWPQRVADVLHVQIAHGLLFHQTGAVGQHAALQMEVQILQHVVDGGIDAAGRSAHVGVPMRHLKGAVFAGPVAAADVFAFVQIFDEGAAAGHAQGPKDAVGDHIIPGLAGDFFRDMSRHIHHVIVVLGLVAEGQIGL